MRICPNKKVIFKPIRGKDNFEILQKLLYDNKIYIEVKGVFDGDAKTYKGIKSPIKLKPLSLNKFVHVIDI